MEEYIKCSDKSIEEYLNYAIQTFNPIMRKRINHDIAWQYIYNNDLIFFTTNILWKWDINELNRKIQETSFSNWKLESKHFNDKHYLHLKSCDLHNDVKKYNRDKYLKDLING